MCFRYPKTPQCCGSGQHAMLDPVSHGTRASPPNAVRLARTDRCTGGAWGCRCRDRVNTPLRSAPRVSTFVSLRLKRTGSAMWRRQPISSPRRTCVSSHCSTRLRSPDGPARAACPFRPTWSRACAPPVPGQGSRTRPLIAELNRIGVRIPPIANNVNQLTRSVHIGADFARYWRGVGDDLAVFAPSCTRPSLRS